MLGENAEDDGGVLDRAGEPAHGIERPRDGHDPVAAHESEGGLDADDAVVCGGAQDGAGGLGAEGHREHPRGGAGGRAAAGSAGRAVGVPRVLRRGRLEHGELGRDRLSEHDASRLFEQRHGGRVVLRHEAFVDLGAPGRLDALGVEDVLDPERDAVQRPGWTTVGQLACALGGGLTRRVLVEGPPYIELRIEGAAARKERVGQLNGREAATSDIGCGLGYGEFIGFSHGALLDYCLLAWGSWDWKAYFLVSGGGYEGGHEYLDGLGGLAGGDQGTVFVRDAVDEGGDVVDHHVAATGKPAPTVARHHRHTLVGRAPHPHRVEGVALRLNEAGIGVVDLDARAVGVEGGSCPVADEDDALDSAARMAHVAESSRR